MKFSILLFALAALSSQIVIGQPITNHGPNEVYYVQDLAEGKDGRIFLSASGGLYYSDDIGESWQRVDAQLNSVYFHPYFTTNQENGDFYAWDLEDGIYSTSDNGVTWNYQIVIMPSGSQITALGIDGDTLFIGTKTGLYYVQGTDFIRNPTEITALQGNDVTDLHVDGEKIIATTKSGKVFVSDDLGDQWEERSNGLPGGSEITGLTVHGSTWYVFSWQIGLYFSDDGGLNWSSKVNGLASQQLNQLVTDGGNLYAATNGYENIYRWDEGAGSWTLIDNGIPNETLPNTLYVKGDNIITGGWHGVFKSKNGGTSYERSQKGITDAFEFRTMQVAPDGTIWAMASHTGVYRMKPGEQIFTLLSDNVSLANYGSSLLNGNILPVVKDYTTTFYDISDNAWKQEYQYINVPHADKFLQTAQGIFLSSRINGVFRYTGTTFFTPFNDGLTSLAVIDLVDIGDKMIAATDDGLYVRGAADPQWEKISFSGTDQGVLRLFIQGSFYLLTASDYNVYLSNDAGETWEIVEDLKSQNVSAYAVADNGVLYAAAFAAVFVSSDGGENWVKREIPSAFINSMVISGGKLFLATLERGIWSTSLKIDQQIVFTDVPEIVNPQSEYILSATTTSGLPVTYTVVSGPCTIDGNVLTILDEGDIVLRVSQAGNDFFNPSTEDYTIRAEFVTGIEEEQEQPLAIYPNPVSNTMKVILGDVSDYGSIRLVNQQGQIILRDEVHGFMEIPTYYLPGGLYYLQFTNGKGTVTKKVLKQ